MIQHVKNHLPQHTEDHIKAYMSNETFIARAIPLWKPSPSVKSEASKWKHHINIGDVGIFNEAGGFNTIFNIFQTEDENIANGYDPPVDFVRFHKSLDQLLLDETPMVYQSVPLKGGMLNGFEPVSQRKQRFGRYKFITVLGKRTYSSISGKSSSSSSPINTTYRANASKCSAIYLESGYRKIALNRWDTLKVFKYVRNNQDFWQQHVEEAAGNQFRERPLLIVISSYRTQSYALAAGSRSRLKEWASGTITLKNSVEGSHTFYSWEVDDGLIHTESAPSSQFMESLDAYFKDMDERRIEEIGPDGRTETRECHCVGIRVCSIRKNGWTGTSILTVKSSKTAIQS
jgi:hypothetical protein